MKKKLVAVIFGSLMMLSSVPVFAGEDLVLKEKQRLEQEESILSKDAEFDSNNFWETDGGSFSVYGEEEDEVKVRN